MIIDGRQEKGDVLESHFGEQEGRKSERQRQKDRKDDECNTKGQLDDRSNEQAVMRLSIIDRLHWNRLVLLYLLHYEDDCDISIGFNPIQRRMQETEGRRSGETEIDDQRDRTEEP